MLIWAFSTGLLKNDGGSVMVHVQDVWLNKKKIDVWGSNQNYYNFWERFFSLGIFCNTGIVCFIRKAMLLNFLYVNHLRRIWTVWNTGIHNIKKVNQCNSVKYKSVWMIFSLSRSSAVNLNFFVSFCSHLRVSIISIPTQSVVLHSSASVIRTPVI